MTVIFLVVVGAGQEAAAPVGADGSTRDCASAEREAPTPTGQLDAVATVLDNTAAAASATADRLGRAIRAVEAVGGRASASPGGVSSSSCLWPGSPSPSLRRQ